ncbi:rab3 GTPase-activating protein catalytic subunit [Tribolium madens]|uniref:rab3 GTPase-activating protein catalytic subunit n=1 Tax=Tribolium madens TaxID=41895 RepID=UPI001CF763A8|nr:rab3 GTPase-activating protein catalytic subunit [Tribolium madens]
MNEEIDESEFYHQDFTTASEWEIFIARIEEIINQWKTEELKDLDNEFGEIWSIKSKNLCFVDVDFKLTFLRKQSSLSKEEDNEEVKKKNPFDTLYDFELYNSMNTVEHSCLSKWYGIDEYIVLSPSGNFGINSESRIKVLLSSVYVASANLKCEIPIFVQIREKWQNCYLGVYESDSIRTNLEMVHLKTSPRSYQYLSGLLEMFKSKILSPMTMTTIMVSLQSSYVLTDFGNFVWKQDYINFDSDHFDGTEVYNVPFGVTVDPIESLILKTSWSHLNHRAVRDSESYSDFDPMLASKWTLLITTAEQPLCLLGECLTEFLHLLNNSSSTYDVLGEFATSATGAADVNNPLDLLTEPKVPTISSLLTRAARNSLTKNRRGVAPLSEEVLVPILYFLFPDAEEDSPHVYKEMFNTNPTNPPQTEENLNLDYECRGFKTCSSDSLIWRLSIVLGHALQSLGGIRAFSHLWFEFVQEMRYRWEKSIPIPGLLPGYPDLRTSLLHQKLQMLNCCIERKQTRENTATNFDSAEGSSTDEEEFFDCADKPEEETKKKEKYSLWNQPVGRLGKFNNLKLLKTGDPLYIPITQEPVPKSEDQLEEDTDVLLKLGSDAQGSELRAKMMSASLLSDMESFKAANPGSVLEDFIRWYSPRDWIEGDDLDEWGQKKGQLSSRMMIEDNFWVQTWESAKPVPAHRQKRLFDDTREAEKVLHFMDSRNLCQICEMLIPVLCHIAIYRLGEESPRELPDSVERLRALIKTTERISRESKLQLRRFESFIQEVTALELRISQVNSLMYKFNPSGAVDENLSNLIGNLVSGREVEIADRVDSTLGNRIVSMFSDAQKAANMILSEQVSEDGKSVKGNAAFPQANEREIVMRVSVPRPATYSAECPQFLRAVLNKNEFRLVGAFSEDIVFF